MGCAPPAHISRFPGECARAAPRNRTYLFLFSRRGPSVLCNAAFSRRFYLQNKPTSSGSVRCPSLLPFYG